MTAQDGEPPLVPVTRSACWRQVGRSDLPRVFLRPDEELEAEIREAVPAGLTPGFAVAFAVQDGFATLSGPVRDRALMPLIARAIRSVGGVVDLRMELDGAVAVAT